MQKLQLYLLLLILILAGCGSKSTDVQNPYLSDKIQLLLPLDRDREAIIQHGQAKVVLFTGSEAAVHFENPDFAHGTWELQWRAGSIPLSREQRHVERSLVSLMVSDSLTATTERITFLPHGAGLVYSLDGRSVDSLLCSIRFGGTDLRTLTLRSHGSRTWSARLSVSAAVAIAVSGRKPQQALNGESAEWTFTTAPAPQRQLVLAFAQAEDSAAALAEEYVRLGEAEAEVKTLATLNEQLAFHLRTQDDRANQLHALLAVALTGAAPRSFPATHEQIESDSRVAVGNFLAGRARPMIVFPPDPRTVTPQQRQDALGDPLPAQCPHVLFVVA